MTTDRFQALSVWLLGFVLVVYLALNGGGYEPLVRDQLGIAIWWGVLLGLAVGALPLNDLSRGSWVALGLLAGYVALVALSATWSNSAEATFSDLGRVATYLGVLALALSIRHRKGARRMVGALAAAIMVVSSIALLSRLHPAWFPEASETANLLEGVRSRLAFPLGYWNGVAALAAIGLPLVLYLAGCARHLVTRSLAAAALPAMVLTVYFTFSRGGTITAVVAAGLFLALARDRVPKLATALLGGAGGAFLILAAGQRDALDSGLSNSLAHDQGNEVLAMTLVICATVGLIHAAVSIGLHERRPAWSRPSRRASLSIAVAVAATLFVALLAVGAPAKASHAWDEFRASRGVSHQSDRLGSFSSNGRWVLWQSALDQAGSDPLKGMGSGSFEVWWARSGTTGGFVRDAHSLYFETLGELGVVGLALLIVFLGWVLVSGARNYARAASSRRTSLAAVLASCAAFCLAVGLDWFWELAVIPIIFLLLASVLVSAGERPRRSPLPLPVRIWGIALALASMVAIAIPLSAASSLLSSQASFRDGDLEAALGDARDAHEVEPFASGPRLQEALVLEAQGRLTEAEAAAADATELEPEQWRAWIVRSRIEAERGRPASAVASYRKARELNPRSPLFAPNQ